MLFFFLFLFFVFFLGGGGGGGGGGAGEVQLKSVDIFLISPQKHTLCVLIRSASKNICCGCSLEVPQ